jgi:hypothetical protein
MIIAFLLPLLALGLGVHYLRTSAASVRTKTIVGGLLVASALFARWLPALTPTVIQFVVSAYILMVYRLQGKPLA